MTSPEPRDRKQQLPLKHSKSFAFQHITRHNAFHCAGESTGAQDDEIIQLI
jgi:hypothetical protein